MNAMEFSMLKIGQPVRIYDGEGQAPTDAVVADKITEHPCICTVLVRIGSGSRRFLKYIDASRVKLREGFYEYSGR